MATVTAANKFRGMHRIRWPKTGEAEMQCGSCYEFWPITWEFWNPVHGVSRCAQCQKERQRVRVRLAMRRRRRGHPDVERAYNADHYRRRYSTLARLQAASAA